MFFRYAVRWSIACRAGFCRGMFLGDVDFNNLSTGDSLFIQKKSPIFSSNMHQIFLSINNDISAFPIIPFTTLTPTPTADSLFKA